MALFITFEGGDGSGKSVQAESLHKKLCQFKPMLVWTPFEGAVSYEVMVSMDPDFAVLEFAHSTIDTFYQVQPDKALKYDITFYWRVRGILKESYVKGRSIVPAVGSPWITSIFTPPAVLTHEPGGTPLGEYVRHLLK